MTALQEIRMEQKVMELEARVAELEEVVAAMGRLMMADQSTVPQDINFNFSGDCHDYLDSLGYQRVTGYVYMNPEKTVRAEIIVNTGMITSSYTIHFSRV